MLERIALDLETGVRGYALTGDRAQLEPYARARRGRGGRRASCSRSRPSRASAHRAQALIGGLERTPSRWRRRRTPGPRPGGDGAGDRARPAGLPRRSWRRSPPTSAPSRCGCAREGTRLRKRAIRIAGRRARAPAGADRACSRSAPVRAIVGPVNRLAALRPRARRGPLRHAPARDRPAGDGRAGARVQPSAPRACSAPPTAIWPSSTPSSATRRSGIAFLDLDLRFLRVNEALARMNQVPGRRASRPHRRRGHRPARRSSARCARSSRPASRCSTSTSRSTAAASRPATSPVRDDRGELLAVGKAMIDVTARRRAEAARGACRTRRRRWPARSPSPTSPRWRSSRRGWRWTPSTAVLLTLDAERGRAADRHRPRPLAAARATRWGTLALVGADARHRRRAHGQSRLHLRRGGAAGALSRSWRARRTRARARTRRCRWSPTGARSACSRSASRARSRSTPTSAALLTALAAQAAIAIARAQLYEREHAVSQTLQASLLPRALPDVPGLDLAGRLESGRQGRRGRRRLLRRVRDSATARGAIAIGDVCGKGVDAAALTALARHTVRAAAHAHDSPAAVLERAQPRGARREPPGPVPDRDLRPPDAAAAAAASG